MNPTYKNPEEALKGVTALAQPTTDAQRQAIAFASSQVPITPAQLAPTQPIQVATTPQYTPPIQAPLPAVANVALTSQEQKAVDQVSPYQALIDQLSGKTSDLAQTSFRKQQAQSTGLNEAQNLAQSLYNKGQSLDLRSQAILAQKQADIQALQTTAQQGGANVTKGGLAPQQRAIETRSNQEQLTNTLAKLDNAVSYYSTLGRVQEAQQAVDAAVDAEFTPKLLALDTAQRNLASLLKSPELTSAEQKRALNLQAQYTAQENAIKEQAQIKKDTGDARIKAINVNLNNPNLAKAMDALSVAQTPLDVAGILAFYGLNSEKDTGFELSAGQTRYDSRGNVIASRPKDTVADGGGSTGVTSRDADSIMNGTLNLQDVSVKDNLRATVASELAQRQKEALKSGDTIGVMRASAAYDKEVSDTFLQSMEKTLAVVSQLQVLQENIADTNTGPIVGLFRGANPWDTNAQTIKAQLNAIVPNLARGVYGEVGVLTDNDIKQYAKTIPTLTSTEDIRNAILYITLDQIRKNVDIKIKNQASGQRDMSGYADIYSNLNQEVDNVLSRLPKGQSTAPLKTGATGQTKSGIKYTIE